MKKIILLLLFCCVSAFSQEKFENYKSTYFGKDYYVNLSKDETSNIKFWVETNSIDKISRDCFIIIETKQVEPFKDFMIKAKETYIKWKKTAIENEVTELNKDLNIEKFNLSSGFKYGKWHFDFSTNLECYFRVVNGKHLLVVSSDELVSNSNSYIKSSGFAMVFSTESDFDNLLNKIDLSKANSFFDSKKNKEDLFEN